ncbi:MAG: hypothetical protein ACR2PF_05910 [Rhizobiaceae bacterium]
MNRIDLAGLAAGFFSGFPAMSPTSSGLPGSKRPFEPNGRCRWANCGKHVGRRSCGWRTRVLSFLMIGFLVLTAPQETYAGDEEEALKECLVLSVFLGPTFMAGCMVGYVVADSSSEDAYPVFNFSNTADLPARTLGNGALIFTKGKPQRLAVGLCKGSPRGCLMEPKLTQAKKDVRRVAFYIIETSGLVEATSFDHADWRYLGNGKYNANESAWELSWHPTNHSAKNGYVLRADFVRRDGSVQTGIGLAIPESAAQIVHSR